MLNVLITGANGFVGSHIVEALLGSKYNIICVVRETSNLKWLKKFKVEYKYGNLNDEKFLHKIVENVDIVIHCAGILYATNRIDYFKVNCIITRKLCKAILEKKHKLKKFIFISSQAGFGPSIAESIDDVYKDNYVVCNPISYYGISKLIAEIEIKKFFYGKIPYTIFRPTAIYGPRDKDMFIIFNLVYNHLVPVTTKKKMFQLVYVKDLANIVLLCLKNDKSNNNIYYVANSTVYTWKDLGDIISSSVNIKTFHIFIPDCVFRFIGLMSKIVSFITKKPNLLNNEKINEILQKYWIYDTKDIENDFNVKFTPLEVASRITYNWYLKNGFLKFIFSLKRNQK
jgi:nucleoside-diphosphate-sugar epimerase